MTNSRTSAQCGTATYEVGTLASPAIPNLSTFVSMFGAGVLNLSATDVVVRGFFDVNNGLSWNLDWVTVTLDGNAEIRLIGTNSELIATNSLFTDCGSPWGRIRVSANTRIFADDCEFTGATEAVLVTSSPQLVTLTNNLFIANNTCLRINGAQTPANHTVSNNRFEISAIGISIAQATNVTIGYNLYESNVNYSIPMIGVQISAGSSSILINSGIMRYLTTGIQSTSSSLVTAQSLVIIAQDGVTANNCSKMLYLKQNSIRAIRYGVNITNHLTNNPALTVQNIFLDRNVVASETNTAIRVDQTIGNGVVNIDNNTIFPAHTPTFLVYGIEVSNTPDARVLVEDNNIQHYNLYAIAPGGIYVLKSETATVVRNNQVTANFYGDMVFGITVAESPNCLVAGNTVNGGPNIMERAISVEMTPQDIVLCCNSVNASTRGLNMSGPHENCHIFETDFNAHADGLYYDMVVSSGADQFHRGNDWSAAATTWDAYFNGSWFFAPFVFYTVDPAYLPSGLTKVFVTGGSASDWFANIAGTEETCSSATISGEGNACDDVPVGGEGGGEEDSITDNDNWAADDLNNENYAALHWTSQRHLFAKLRRTPALIGHSELIEDFYTAAEAGNLALFHEVSHGLARLHELPADIAEAYWATHAAIDALGQELADLDEEIAGAQPENLPALLDQQAALVADIEAATETLAGYEQQRSTTAAQRIADLTALNAAISPVTDYEADAKAMNAIHLDALAQNDWDFDVAEEAAIDAIAARCPQYNGPAAYHARSLQEHYRVPDWSNSDCTPISERAGGGNAAQATNSNMRVFPNPATGIARIEWGSPTSGACQLQVFNLTGQLMRTETIKEGATTFSLPVGELPNGHYFLHVSDSSRNLYRQKLAILH